jgi:PAS domain S-box-containing protein/putative nucleotidyltransferase with HDIG domain
MKKKIDEGHKNKTVSLNTTNRHKLAEVSQLEIEEKFRDLLENVREGYFEIDLAGNFTFISDSVCSVLGYSRKELMGINSGEFTDQDDIKKVSKAYNKVYKTGKPLKNFNWHIIIKDRSKRYLDGSISLRKDLSGKPMGFRVIANDITERKQVEEALRESEARYRLLADNMIDTIWLMDMNLNVIYNSPSVEKRRGFTDKEVKQMPVEKHLTPESFNKAITVFSEKMFKIKADPNYSPIHTLELEFYRKDGTKVWTEATLSLIRDENRIPVSILAEGRDITERKQIEYELQASEANFRHSLNNSPLGVRISSIEGETIYANRAILDIYGYGSIEELKKTPLKERYTPESYAEFQLRKEKRLRGEFGPSEYKISIVRKNGEIRHLYVFRKEIFWNGEKQSQVIYQDITERRQAEETLRETLESLRKSIKTTIQVLGTASEARDPYTAGHQKKVADLARAIATEMGLSHEKIEGIRMASSIHDIGKISIPAEILSKPTNLTKTEFSLIKEHSKSGYEMLKDVESPWPLAQIISQHHERMNGSGYPKNLKGDEILLEARIMAVADVVEAMASHRPYRASLGIEAALEEITKNKGILYDDAVADACLRLFREKGYHLT